MDVPGVFGAEKGLGKDVLNIRKTASALASTFGALTLGFVTLTLGFGALTILMVLFELFDFCFGFLLISHAFPFIKKT